LPASEFEAILSEAPGNNPVAASDNFKVAVDTAFVSQQSVLQNDFDANPFDELEAILLDGVSNGTLILNSDGTFEYQPNQEFRGLDRFTYVATDGTSTSKVVEVVLDVNYLAVDDFDGTSAGLDVSWKGHIVKDESDAGFSLRLNPIRFPGATRSADLSQANGVQLQFDYETTNFEEGDRGTVEIFTEDQWVMIYEITSPSSDVQTVNLDLSGFELGSDFSLRFVVEGDRRNDTVKLDNVFLANDEQVFASDDFESGNETGGTGWLGAWETRHSVSEDLTNADNALRVRGSGNASIDVDVSSVQQPLALEFDSRIESLEEDDNAYVEVWDGEQWITLATFGSADEEEQSVSITISPDLFNEDFAIRFRMDGDERNDEWFIDDFALKLL